MKELIVRNKGMPWCVQLDQVDLDLLYRLKWKIRYASPGKVQVYMRCNRRIVSMGQVIAVLKELSLGEGEALCGSIAAGEYVELGERLEGRTPVKHRDGDRLNFSRDNLMGGVRVGGDLRGMLDRLSEAGEAGEAEGGEG